MTERVSTERLRRYASSALDDDMRALARELLAVREAARAMESPEAVTDRVCDACTNQESCARACWGCVADVVRRRDAAWAAAVEAARAPLVALLREAVHALGDLRFECDGALGTRAPTSGTYNRTFDTLERLRAALAAAPADQDLPYVPGVLTGPVPAPAPTPVVIPDLGIVPCPHGQMLECAKCEAAEPPFDPDGMKLTAPAPAPAADAPAGAPAALDVDSPPGDAPERSSSSVAPAVSATGHSESALAVRLLRIALADGCAWPEGWWRCANGADCNCRPVRELTGAAKAEAERIARAAGLLPGGTDGR